MNNRIEELAAEAEEYADFYSAIADETEFSIFKRRFAELLLTECVIVLSKAVDQREPASTYVEKLLDYFYPEDLEDQQPTEYDEWQDFDPEC